MEHNCFWIDDMCSDDIDVHLQGPVSFSAAEPNVKTVSVPGRNGDLHIFGGSYKNVSGEARCFALEPEYVETVLHAVSKWCLLSSGYHKLQTSEEPAHYRLARIAVGPETEIRLRRLAPFTIRFDCKPQRFLISGDHPQNLTAPTVLHNDGFPALPIIKVYGIGDGTLTVGGITVNLLGLEDTITLDCEMQNAYREVGGVLENMNLHIYAPEFPNLPPGDTAVSWTGGVQRVEIIPRWWTV